MPETRHAADQGSRPTEPGSPTSLAAMTFTLSDIFGNEATPPASSPPPKPVAPAPEDPAVAEAVTRAETLFPDVMKASGQAIREALAPMVPPSFEKIAGLGAEPLAKIASLVAHVSTLTEGVHRTDAAKELGDIVAAAKQGKTKSVLRDLVGVGSRFDPGAAVARIDAIRGALTEERYAVLKTAIDIDRAVLPLNTALAVARILADVASGDEIKAVVERRSDLLHASATEAEMAKKQLENLQKLAEEQILQCDEVRSVTLPAMGFRQSL